MLIGLTGAVGAGKDSAAQVLCAAGWASAAFADALRIEVASHWHVDPRLLTDRASKEQPHPGMAVGNAEHADWLRYCAVQGYSLVAARSPRWVLQQWGSWRRGQNAQHWVRHLRSWLEIQHAHGQQNLVVTDVRHQNEAEFIHDHGGHLVRVHRKDLSALASDTRSHESENHGSLPADADIHNDGSLASLSAEVWRVVDALAQRDQQA